jgi:hypothetical protein
MSKTDKNAEVRSIIENTLRQLVDLGMTPEGAAALLVVQGAIRIASPEKRAEMAEFVASTFGEQP